jgi:DNA helicase HerA-like ATPase
VRSTLRLWLRQAATALEYVSSNTARYYFAKAREYQTANIVAYTPPERASAEPTRLRVVDLPSLREIDTRMLVTSAIVAMEWERATNEWAAAFENVPEEDRRVPTFIVLDEAHNLIAREPRGRAAELLREQFRTMVAEGRKYGLFLILVTQRPDKIDPLVVSECENRAVMRLHSTASLGISRDLLGLEDVPTKMIERTLEFAPGRALLIGPWADDGVVATYCAARRTREGGRNLRPEYWATPVS